MATNDADTGGVAGRYASALFELAVDEQKLVDVEADIKALRRLLDESPDLVRMVRSPVFSSDEQARAIGAIVGKGGMSGLTGNFLQLLARNRRLHALPEMIKAFLTLAARRRGEVTAEVASAHELSEAQIVALKDTLRASAGKDVTLVTKVDPTLIGGLVVKLGSRMIDSSLRTKLNALKTVMKEVR